MAGLLHQEFTAAFTKDESGMNIHIPIYSLRLVYRVSASSRETPEALGHLAYRYPAGRLAEHEGGKGVRQGLRMCDSRRRGIG